MRWKVLLFESDQVRLSVLSSWLRDEGIDCWSFDSPNAAISALSEQSFDSIILGKDFSGGEATVLNHLRCRLHSTTPALFIPAKDDQKNIVDALKRGADDYLLQPLKRSEFTAVVEAQASYSDKQLTLSDCYPYEFNEHNHDILLHGESLRLTKAEYILAAYLFFFRNRIILSTELVRELCVDSGVIGEISLDIQVMSLKKRLRLKESNCWNLKSLRGIGYRLNRQVNKQIQFRSEVVVTD